MSDDAAQTGTYLDTIVADVRARLNEEASAPPGRRPDEPGPVRSLRESIRAKRDAGELGVIAEIKRRSPSVGSIDESVDPKVRAALYAAAGAAGISVLTETDHFGGRLEDLLAARSGSAAVPILRKDFVVEHSQLASARAMGADAVLLIAALHGPGRLGSLVDGARSLGLEVLLEVHDEKELERALGTKAEMIGINARDLRTFEVDLAVVERLAPLVSSDRVIVAESGIRSIEDAARVAAAGVDAMLVGEAFMRSNDPTQLLQAFAASGLPAQESA